MNSKTRNGPCTMLWKGSLIRDIEWFMLCRIRRKNDLRLDIFSMWEKYKLDGNDWVLRQIEKKQEELKKMDDT